MDMNNLSPDILKQILDRLLPILDKKVTVFLTGGLSDPSNIIRSIDSMLATKASLILTDSCKSILSGTVIDKYNNRNLDCCENVLNTVLESNLILVPVLTRNTLVKVAVGIQDGIVTTGLATAIMRNIPMIAVKDNYHPDSEQTNIAAFNQNTAYNKMLLDHEEKLRSYGVKLVDGCEFDTTVKQNLYPWLFNDVAPVAEGKPLDYQIESMIITYQDLAGIPHGAIVALPKQAVVTPLAMDFIQQARLTVRHIK